MTYGQIKSTALNLADINADEAPEFIDRIPELCNEGINAVWGGLCSKTVSGRPYGMRKPRELCPNPPDGKRIMLISEAAACIPYYIAAQLVLYDDAARAQVLSNEFQLRLARIRLPLIAVEKPIKEVY